MIIANIIYGLIGIVIGVVLVRYAYVITENTSSIGWVENHIGAGRTPDFYRVVGFAVIFLSMLLAVGLLYPAIHAVETYISHILGL